ncbi:MAG: Quinolinate synthetase [uncultured Thermomicrobiales bacterium]|uniref:Quinolinate synthase n=1 Tax=uncultured Thermomicrobiales bacterium TaxID=1645740 RepID=A0A6J4UI02_9BACT|nr:MAG: Quinolinate synthetase [uncultured Thermomicrobiales bacterium]
MAVNRNQATFNLWPDSSSATSTIDDSRPDTSRDKATLWLVDPQMESASCVPEEGTGAYDQLHAYGVEPLQQERIPREYFKMPAEERDARIWALRHELGSRLTILGHHYQRDEVIQFADFQGDSYKLSQQAAVQTSSEFTLFCGVHFMAESADILGGADQHVILPNLEAGCSMADMAKPEDVEAAWNELERLGIAGVVPITYMNSAASLKAFCGRNGGIVCTSSNAARVYDWAFERGERIFFFPDEHLGRNTAVRKGIPTEDMVVWDPFQPLGGNTEAQLRAARVILWKGYCSVHARFSVEQIANARERYPDVNVVVHPECRLEVVQASDLDGSTEYIIDVIRAAEPGTVWAVGTEINLVRRLQQQMPDKTIFCLDPVICPCSTMYRVHPSYILWTLEHLVKGKIVNEIKVETKIAEEARVALDRMLAVP